MFEAAEAEATAAAAATAALRSLFMLDSRAFKSSLSRRPSLFSVYLLLRLRELKKTKYYHLKIMIIEKIAKSTVLYFQNCSDLL